MLSATSLVTLSLYVFFFDSKSVYPPPGDDWPLTCAVSSTPETGTPSAPSADAWLGSNLHPSNQLVYQIPTERFWDNLRGDKKYITSWPSSGWTNDVMTMGNLFYMARLTGRIPIFPKFVPTHAALDGDHRSIPFSEVFDTKYLSQKTGIPVLEWPQVKDENSTHVDNLGCWNVWEATQEAEHHPRNSQTPDEISVDISYTKLPKDIKTTDIFTTFWHLAPYSQSNVRERRLRDQSPDPSPLHQVTLHPSEHLLCFDYLYYVTAQWPYDFLEPWSPAWTDAMQYFRWTERLETIADKYLRRAMHITDDSVSTPAYIAVHVRHADFAVHCEGDYSSKEDCYAPLSAYAIRVREIQLELLEKKGIDVTRVVMTSDERDPAWWADVDALGWVYVDSEKEKVVEEYGAWYPVFIDAVIQSGGVGFVGTEQSTMSYIAMRRVETWQEGVGKIVQWGFPGADDH